MKLAIELESRYWNVSEMTSENLNDYLLLTTYTLVNLIKKHELQATVVLRTIFHILTLKFFRVHSFTQHLKTTIE
jgi:hypothetical protein